jgi:uncharacterized protein with PhoU and TrkA domain
MVRDYRDLVIDALIVDDRVLQDRILELEDRIRELERDLDRRRLMISVALALLHRAVSDPQGFQRVIRRAQQDQRVIARSFINDLFAGR